MLRVLPLLLLCAAAHAAEVTLPPAPPPVFFDTECVTNAPLGRALETSRFLRNISRRLERLRFSRFRAATTLFFSNPKYDSRSVCPVNSPTRSGFGRHMFVEANGKVFDACVGPHLGTETLSAYLSSTIDTITTNTTFVTGVSTNVNQFILDWIE